MKQSRNTVSPVVGTITETMTIRVVWLCRGSGKLSASVAEGDAVAEGRNQFGMTGDGGKSGVQPSYPSHVLRDTYESFRKELKYSLNSEVTTG